MSCPECATCLQCGNNPNAIRMTDNDIMYTVPGKQGENKLDIQYEVGQRKFKVQSNVHSDEYIGDRIFVPMHIQDHLYQKTNEDPFERYTLKDVWKQRRDVMVNERLKNGVPRTYLIPTYPDTFVKRPYTGPSCPVCGRCEQCGHDVEAIRVSDDGRNIMYKERPGNEYKQLTLKYDNNANADIQSVVPSVKNPPFIGMKVSVPEHVQEHLFLEEEPDEPRYWEKEPEPEFQKRYRKHSLKDVWKQRRAARVLLDDQEFERGYPDTFLTRKPPSAPPKKTN